MEIEYQLKALFGGETNEIYIKWGDLANMSWIELIFVAICINNGANCKYKDNIIGISNTYHQYDLYSKHVFFLAILRPIEYKKKLLKLNNYKCEPINTVFSETDELLAVLRGHKYHKVELIKNFLKATIPDYKDRLLMMDFNDEFCDLYPNEDAIAIKSARNV